MPRLNKYLADAGLGSRRHCEELIRAGRVTLDGVRVTALATAVAAGQTVAVDGRKIQPQRLVYWLVNKPAGYLCTNADPAGRPRVVDLLDHVPERIYTVGRLDEASEGLVLVTNDGALALRLTHPRYGIEKTYEVLVAGQPTEETERRLVEGVRLSEGRARAVRVRRVETRSNSTLLQIVLAEGKNREIRRMLAKVGHKVLRLKRVAIGPIPLDRLKPGKCRKLSVAERELLQRLAARKPGGSERRHAARRPAAGPPSASA